MAPKFIDDKLFEDFADTFRSNTDAEMEAFLSKLEKKPEGHNTIAADQGEALEALKLASMMPIITEFLKKADLEYSNNVVEKVFELMTCVEITDSAKPEVSRENRLLELMLNVGILAAYNDHSVNTNTDIQSLFRKAGAYKHLSERSVKTRLAMLAPTTTSLKENTKFADNLALAAEDGNLTPLAVIKFHRLLRETYKFVHAKHKMVYMDSIYERIMRDVTEVFATSP